MAKGPKFEREICKQLSLWWTQDDEEPTDAVFWRTSMSGGRATVRQKKGKKTKNQLGDICATDPAGQPFMDLVSLELKRGYSTRSLADLFDQTVSAGGRDYEEWITKLIRTQKLANACSWLLIVCRNKRAAAVYMPLYLHEGLDRVGASLGACHPRIQVDSALEGDRLLRTIVGVRLLDFMGRVKPAHVRQLVAEWKGAARQA